MIYHDLNVYILAKNIAVEVYRITEDLPNKP